jgi:transcriptional regulator with XRE-family HTH domain
MEKLIELDDPVREALVHGERTPKTFASWSTAEVLRRLRIRFALNRKELAARAGLSPSLVGRAERGADVRLSTLRKIYAAVDCRLLLIPAGALDDLDWKEAHIDNEWIDWRRKNSEFLRSD